ncbi:MAG: glycosyltransferase [Nitrospirota bacterium]
MQSFFEWFKADPERQNKPWLILGKGHSFSKRTQFDLQAYQIFSLNHVVRELPVTVSHIIDYDVVEACGEAIERNAQVLVMPWIPHVKNKPGTLNLQEYAAKDSVLKRLNSQHRLLWYNASTTSQHRPDSPVVQVVFFSVEAALNLLAIAGVRTVRSLGIDGGNTYSATFDDLKEKTLLANQVKSFDKQFEGIAKTLFTTGVNYAPLDIPSPIRVYVGATEEQMLSVKVLEYSIRKHASMSVEVFPLHRAGIDVPSPKDPKNHPRTPFTFQRFLIPELAGYQGRAIYMDSDMQVLRDIRSLWTLPFLGADLLAVGAANRHRRPQFSVMLLNCDTLHWEINALISALDNQELSYEQMVHEMAVAKTIRTDIDPSWNSLEQFKKGETALIHYTDMDTQPWVSTENPIGDIWIKDLIEAVTSGFIAVDEIKEQIQKGWIRPSLLYQIEHQIADSLLLPSIAHQLDKNFIAPYKMIDAQSGKVLSRFKRLKAAVRRHYQSTILFRLQRKLSQRLTRPKNLRSMA